MKKENILFIIIAIFVMIITGLTTSYAISNYIYSGNEVSYDNSVSGISSDNVQGAIDELYEEATNYTEIRKLIYPIGSIYISVSDDTVSKVEARFGGNWQSFGAGKMLVGVNTSETEFNTVEKTGGEKTHKLTISEMPAHRHLLIRQQWFGADILYTSSSIYSWKSSTGGATSYGYKTNATNLADNSSDMLTTGGDGSHNNIPPYVTVYMYKRVS